MTNRVTTRFVYRNPLDLPRISHSDIVRDSAEGVYVEEPATPRIFRRASPLFHDDPDGAGLFPSLPELTVTYPPVFTVSLRNVTLADWRSVLTRDGFLVNDLGHLTADDARDFARGLARADEIDQLIPVADGEAFALRERPRAEVHLEGPIVVVTSAEPGNFGSFIYRDLIKLVNLVDIPASWRFLAHAPGKSFGQFLELAGLPMERVIRHDLRTVYHIDQAIIPGLRSPYAFADPQARAFYDRLRAKCAPGAVGRRLYVSRRLSSAADPKGRVMLNEAELIERLRPLGFLVIEPQQLTAAEQVATFASADLVVGPSGSGMFNAVFCRPGTKLIDIESEPHWIYPHTSLFASAGLQYGVFEGVAADRDWSVHHKPWKVNIEALLRRIDAFANPGSSAKDAASGALDEPPTRFWSKPDHAGEVYTAVLERAHRTFHPQTYLEIGVAEGGSLALANCSSIAVDPQFNLRRPVPAGKPPCCFYQMASDEFFKNHDPTSILGRPIDMAFLDGLHWYEVLLRDFINTERYCKPDSIIFMHDCLPTDEYVGRRDFDDQRLRRRSAHPEWHAGDVWKTLVILLKSRPDLHIAVLNAFPTGLVAVTRLDPTSTLLADRYFDLVEEYKKQSLKDCGDDFYDKIDMLDTRQFAFDLCWNFDDPDIHTGIADVFGISARTERGVVFTRGMSGVAVYGPYVPVLPGAYTVIMDFDERTTVTGLTGAIVDVVASKGRMTLKAFKDYELWLNDNHQLVFEFSTATSIADLEVRLILSGNSEGCFKKIRIVGEDAFRRGRH